MWPDAVTLTGKAVTLAPLSPDHAPALRAACKDGALYNLWYTTVPTPEDMDAEIARRMGLANMQPFTILTPDGMPVGMTTFMNIDAVNKRLEIGSTWYRKAVQRGPMNTEAKLLLLAHAFDDLGCIAVEFRTHFMNRQSRAAIERLGAKLDGVLRSHMVMPDGSLRDTVVYSIIASEWPAVRANLSWSLNKPRD